MQYKCLPHVCTRRHVLIPLLQPPAPVARRGCGRGALLDRQRSKPTERTSSCSTTRRNTDIARDGLGYTVHWHHSWFQLTKAQTPRYSVICVASHGVVWDDSVLCEVSRACCLGPELPSIFNARSPNVAGGPTTHRAAHLHPFSLHSTKCFSEQKF